MDSQALVPEAADLVLDESEVVESQGVSEALQAEKELAAVASTPGWQHIAAQMKADIEAFRTGKSVDIDPKADLAAIGQRYIIASTVADHLQAYLDMVNSSLEAVVEHERTNKS